MFKIQGKQKLKPWDFQRAQVGWSQPLSWICLFVGSLILEFAGSWMALMPWGTEAGQLGQEHCPALWDQRQRWDLSRFIHPFIKNSIVSHAREEVGARHLTAVLLN